MTDETLDKLMAHLEATEHIPFNDGWHTCMYCDGGEIEYDRLKAVIRQFLEENG